MILDISANRMELLKLKRRLVIATKGHKLLKDKQDELMRQFLELIDEIKGLRSNVEKRLMRAFDSFLMARAVMDRENLEAAIMFPKQQLSLIVDTEPVMNLRVPRFQLSSEGRKGDPPDSPYFSYGFLNTSAELDSSLKFYSELLPEMIKLAQTERTVELIADEIEKTRRRVNALAYILIPNLKDTIRYITMRLDEMERSNLTRLMKVKEMVGSR